MLNKFFCGESMMNRNESLEKKLITSVSTLDVDEVDPLIDQLLAHGYKNMDIIPLMNEGVANVGTHFEHGDYYLADLILSGTMYSEVLKRLEDNDADDQKDAIGTIVIGVMENDIHDIGKNIVAGLLQLEGFNVIDLGVNVGPQSFLNAALQYRPGIIVLCGMMNYSSVGMKQTIQLLERGNVRSFARIIIGGGCVCQTVCNQVHADAFFCELDDTLRYCKQHARYGMVP